MRLIWILATLVVCATAASLSKQSTVNNKEKIRYDNFKVYKIRISDKLQLAVLDFIRAKSEKYNIWKDYDAASKEIHVMVNPQEVFNFLRILKFNGFESKLLINNVQELINEEENFSNSKADSSAFDWKRYYQLHEIEQWLDGILAAYPNVTQGINIGKSYENRNLRVIKISYKFGNPGIFIESNIHAREWITSATATWFINQLLTSTNADVRNLAENYDWYIIPVLNVDGFVYSHVKDRMWRKTRQPVEATKCIGADSNRNFDSHWMENGGASSNPCDETFAGTKPFSEPEAAALANYVSLIKDKIKIYLSFHSYGQYLLSPYGHSPVEFPENYDDIQTIGKAFHDGVADLSYKTKYEYGSTASVLYVASGTSIDWVFNTLGVKLVYTIEFRDKGRYGFVLPPAQIPANCEELMAGITALVMKAKAMNYI